MKKFFKSLTIAEILLWVISSITVTVCFFIFKNTQYHYLIGSLIGIAGLIIVSKGNPAGQEVIIVFSVFYGIISYSFRYYGEMITYLGMSAPIAAWALITWIKNPYAEGEVKVNRLSRLEICLFCVGSLAATAAFYFILRALNSAILFVSTFPVLPSFTASYVTVRRICFYAVFYGLNDIVLIVLWALASIKDLTYLPMVICFVAFLVLDIYGFINWTRMEKKQKTDKVT